MEQVPSAQSSTETARKHTWPAVDKSSSSSALDTVSSSLTSPHSSTLSTPSTSYSASPWSNNLQLAAFAAALASASASRNQMPIPFFPDGNQSSHSHSSHTPAQIPPQMAAFDWNHILQSPLDPAMFAALEAGGALGPLPKSPFGQANHLHQQQHNDDDEDEEDVGLTCTT